MPRICVRCGGTFEQGASRCNFCGTADEATGAEPAAPKAKAEEENLSSRERARRRLEAEGRIELPTRKSRLRSMAIGVGVVLSVFLFFCPHVTMGLMGGPYRKAVTELAGCEAARDALGDDIHLSWLGFPYGSNHGSSGGFRFPVSGSKKSADLNYSFHGDQVEWTLLVSGQSVVDDKACRAAASGITPPASASASAKKPEKPLRVQRDPLLFDVNKDGHDDAIVLVDQSGSPYTYAAIDGMTGKTLWRSETIEPSTSKAFLVGEWLVLASNAGMLSAYDLVHDKAAWATTLGERFEQLCEAPDGASVRVDLAGDKSFLVALKTGGQSPALRKPPCRALRSNNGYITPYVDPSSGAPRVGDHLWCGSHKTKEGTIPDPCLARAHVDPDAVDGIAVTSLWVVEGGAVVIGERHPGSAYPMVGLVRDRKLVWKSDVPVGNPLLATERPESTQLAGSKIIVSYEARPDTFVTGFDVATGHRDWNVSFGPSWPPTVWASRDTVFALATATHTFVGYATDTGAERFSMSDR